MPYSGGKLVIPVHRYIGKGLTGKNFGGNFIFKYDKDKNIYAIVVKAAIDIFSDPIYTPDGFLGFDINETPTDWIVYSDGTKVQRPGEMSAKIKENRILNYEISNTNKQAEIKLQDGTVKVLRTKERRKRRLQQREVLKEIQKLTKPFAEEVVNRAIAEKKGIAIDKINPGASGSGEFGQYISNYIIQLCEDKNIPFFVCPSAYTSRRCICGNEDKKNRSGDNFKCVECGYTSNSHVHAAQNMVRIAEDFYRHGAMYCCTKAKNVNQFKRESDILWNRYEGKSSQTQTELEDV
jgi:transposase